MATPIVMPKLGMVMSEGVINSWKKSSGDPIDSGEIIAEIETEKLNYELEATNSGILHIIHNAGVSVEVDGVIGYILSENEPVPEPETQPSLTSENQDNSPLQESQQPSIPAKNNQKSDVIPSTPGARKLAKNLNVDISLIKGTGPRGRITESDVRTFSENLPVDQSSGDPLTGIRKSIASHMKSSLSDTAQLSFFIELDVTETQSFRKNLSKENNIKVGLNHIFIKASSLAIKSVPKINSTFQNNLLTKHENVNVGIAVALKEGLIVPVIQNVEDLTILEISNSTDKLVEKARTGKLSSDEISKGTFTISALGVVDGFTPILNAGQSAILGIGRSVEKPVVIKGQIVIREMLVASLTVDHQIIDGADAALFIRRLKQSIENPNKFLQ